MHDRLQVGAKNTLDTNYLYLAEKNGAQVYPDTEVVDIVPLAGGGYEVRHGAARGVAAKPPPSARSRADHVVLSASALGTQKLLHRLRDEGSLPDLSDRLGWLSRTNSESILGAKAETAEVDHSKGIAITSSFHPDADTHIEPVRYGKGSNAMGVLDAPLTDAGGRIPRGVRVLAEVAPAPGALRAGGVGAPLVRAHDHPPRHADPRQLDQGRAAQSGSSRPSRATASPTPRGSPRATRPPAAPPPTSTAWPGRS